MNNYTRATVSAEMKAFIDGIQSEAQLKSLLVYNPPNIPKRSNIQHLVIPDGWNSACQTYAGEQWERKKSGGATFVGDLESIFVRNGHVRYFDTHAVLVNKDGEEKEIKNTSIPIPAEIAPRTGMEASTKFVTAFIDMEKGKLVRINEEGWVEKFQLKGSSVNVNAIPMVVDTVSIIFNKDIEFQSLVKGKKTLKGRAFLTLTIRVLTRAEQKDYWALHGRIAYDLLGAVRYDEKTRKVIPQTTEKGTVKARPGAIGLVPAAKVDKASYDEYMYVVRQPPVVLIGPFLNAHRPFPNTQCDLTSAIACYTRSQAFRGGNDRGLGFYSSNLNFSFLPSEQTRHRLRILQVLIPLLMEGKTCDVISAGSDVESLLKSVQLQASRFNRSDIVNKVGFVLSRKDFNNVLTIYKPLCYLSVREKTVTVYVSNTAIPTVSKGVDPEVYLSNELASFSRQVNTEYIAYVPVCHPDFFVAPKNDNGSQQHKISVYAEGAYITDFRAYVSNFSVIKRCYVSINAKEKTYQYCEKELQRFGSAEEFWKRIIDSNNRANAWFLNGTPVINVVGNLLAPVKPPIFNGLVDEGGDAEFATEESISEIVNFTDGKMPVERVYDLSPLKPASPLFEVELSAQDQTAKKLLPIPTEPLPSPLHKLSAPPPQKEKLEKGDGEEGPPLVVSSSQKEKLEKKKDEDSPGLGELDGYEGGDGNVEGAFEFTDEVS